MRMLKFSLPLFSFIPASIGLLMIWGFLTLFNAVRFTVCPSWVLLQPPPGHTVALLGAQFTRLYIETDNKSVFCLKQGQWVKCSLPSDGFQPDLAPSWLINNFNAAFQDGEVLQVIRSADFFDMNYYTLHKDGRLSSCATNIDAEIGEIFRSGKFVWLLIPLIGLVWSITTFVNIFIKSGVPTLTDFWGRTERIK